jgi:hypothetical protein
LQTARGVEIAVKFLIVGETVGGEPLWSITKWQADSNGSGEEIIHLAFPLKGPEVKVSFSVLSI